MIESLLRTDYRSMKHKYVFVLALIVMAPASASAEDIRAEMAEISSSLPDDLSFASHMASVAIKTALQTAVAAEVAGARALQLPVTLPIWDRAVTISWPFFRGQAIQQPSAGDLVRTLQSSRGIYRITAVPTDVAILTWHRVAAFAEDNARHSTGTEKVIWQRAGYGARFMRDYLRGMKRAGQYILDAVPADTLWAVARTYIGLP